METDGGGDTTTRVVGWVFLILGSLATVVLFYSPSKIIRAIKEAGDIGQQKADLYLAVLLNCLFWLLYGFVTDKDAWLVILINAVGVCFQLYYLYVFIRASTDRFTISCTVLLLFLIVASGAGIIFQSFPTNAERKTVLGRVGIVTGCIMYLGSARQLWAAICDNNVLEVMELRVMLAALANGIFWTIYIGIIQDLYMGVRVSLLQIK